MNYYDDMQRLTNLVTEVATDMKWLKKVTEDNAIANCKQHDKIIEHLAKLNGTTTRNKMSIAGLWATVIIVIGVLLHLMGVY